MASKASPTNSFDLDRYEKELDRKREGHNWKRGQQILIDSIDNKLTQTHYYSKDDDAQKEDAEDEDTEEEDAEDEDAEEEDSQVTLNQAGCRTPRLNVEDHDWSWTTHKTDDTTYISKLNYRRTNPAHPEEPISPRESFSITEIQRRRSASNIMIRWLYQKPLKMVKVFLNLCWNRKNMIFWSALISLFLWFIFHIRGSLSRNLSHLYICHFPFCISSATPAPSMKLNVTETLVSANNNLTSLVEHVAVMHAFPELLFGLQWTMTNLSADMRAASHFPETRRNLLFEFREYRSASSAVYSVIKMLFSGIYEDVGLVLTFTYTTIEQLQRLRNSTSSRKKKFFANFMKGLNRHPTRPIIGIRIPLNFEHHLDRLVPKLKRNINAGERVIADFTELLRRLDNIQAIANNDRDRCKAAHVSIINSRVPKLRRWIGSVIMKGGPFEDVPNPDERLAYLRPVIIQGSQSIEFILSRYRTIYMDLERLADQMKQHERWAYELSPQALVHDLRLGVKSLTETTEEWIQLLMDDSAFLHLNPNADRELNPLTRKIEAEAEARKKRVREQREGVGEGGKD